MDKESRFLRNPDEGGGPEALQGGVCQDWDNVAFIGFEGINTTVISFVASLVFGFTVGKRAINVFKVYPVLLLF